MGKSMGIFAILLVIVLLAGCRSGGLIVKPTAPPASGEATEASVPETTLPSSEPSDPTETIGEDPTEPDRTETGELTQFVSSEKELALMDLICQQRKQPLSTATDRKLCALAYRRSLELTKSFSHTRPDGTGYETILQKMGWNGGASAELMLKVPDGYPMEYVLDDWLHLDSTRKQLQSSEFTHLGVGICQEGKELYIVCLLIKQ